MVPTVSQSLRLACILILAAEGISASNVTIVIELATIHLYQNQTMSIRCHIYIEEIQLQWRMYMRQCTWSALVHVMACCLFIAEPLPEKRANFIVNWNLGNKLQILIIIR